MRLYMSLEAAEARCYMFAGRALHNGGVSCFKFILGAINSACTPGKHVFNVFSGRVDRCKCRHTPWALVGDGEKASERSCTVVPSLVEL